MNTNAKCWCSTIDTGRHLFGSGPLESLHTGGKVSFRVMHARLRRVTTNVSLCALGGNCERQRKVDRGANQNQTKRIIGW